MLWILCKNVLKLILFGNLKVSLYLLFDDFHTNMTVATIFTARASRATIHSKDMKDAKFIRDLRDEYVVRLDTKKMNKMGETKGSD